MKNINQNKFKIVSVVLIVILLAVIVYFIGFNQQNKDVSANYSVVYLSTGEVYIGKLATFPNLTLSDGFVLQTMKDPTDPTKSTFGLNPFKNTFWGAEKLHLNREQVVFYGIVGKDSQIGKALAEQGK